MTLAKSWQFIGPVGSLWYRAYDALRRGVNRRLTDFICEPVCASLHQQGAVRALEAGSGTAFASSLMAQRAEIDCAVCLDLDIEALTEAKKAHPQVRPVVGDLRNMPFGDAAFSLVFNNSTVEHLDQPENAVAEMRRVCDAGGSVFVGVPYAWGPLAFQPIMHNTRVGVWLGRVFTRPALDNMLRSAGLTPVAHRRFFWRFFIGALARKSPDALTC